MILVTGATGLVGSHLALHLLENNKKVRAIYRTLSAIEKTRLLFRLYKKEPLFEKIEWIQADILDIPSLEMAFRDIKFVYHCAALVSFDPKQEELIRKTNIEGTANIVNFCLEYKIQKLCYISSIAALGDLKEHETTITEETEWNPEKPHSDYAISKFGAEMEIWRGQQEGLNVVIVNPGVILGPGFWDSGSGAIFTKAKKGLPFYTKGSTGFVSVNDVVKISEQLMESEISGERFIVVTSNIPFENLLIQLAKALKKSPPSIYAKPWMTTISWKIDWVMATFFLRKRTLSKTVAQSLHTSDFISNDKIKMILNYDFQSIETYIPEIVAFLKP